MGIVRAQPVRRPGPGLRVRRALGGVVESVASLVLTVPYGLGFAAASLFLVGKAVLSALLLGWRQAWATAAEQEAARRQHGPSS